MRMVGAGYLRVQVPPHKGVPLDTLAAFERGMRCQSGTL